MSRRRKQFAARLDRALDKAHNHGKLQWFNAAFAAERAKDPVLNYRSARIRLRNVLAKRMLRRLPVSTAILLAEIFPRRSPANEQPLAEMDRADGMCQREDKRHQRAR